MFEIKVNEVNGDYFYTKINADLEEVARYYFSAQHVESIDILSGGAVETEFCTIQPLKLYRETPEAIKEHELFYDIILTRKTTYKLDQPFGFEDTVSFGFIRTH